LLHVAANSPADSRTSGKTPPENPLFFHAPACREQGPEKLKSGKQSRVASGRGGY
jgi:hypothetical protein